MFAIYDENPYPPNSISHKIWENNRKLGTGRIYSATDNEKFILYLYIMGKNIKNISEMCKISAGAVVNLLTKYHIN
jgi:hypothetical protein